MPATDPETVDRRRVEAFGRRVRAVRESLGLSQEELAEHAGLHRAVVGFVERAEREVGVSNAWRLADGLGMELSELLDGVDHKRPSTVRRQR